MKTRKFTMIVAMAFIFIAISCSDDFLDETPYSSYAPETLTDEAGIEAALKGLHYRFGQLWTWSNRQGWNCVWQVGTDVCSPGGIEGVEIPFFKYEDLNGENGAVSYMWSQCYQIINNANNTLKAIGEDGDPEKIGEALFFRAYAYNLLATLYGDVPLLTEPTSSAKTDFVRTPVAEVNAQIIADLIYAADNLPAIDGTVSESRANKHMAMQCLGEVYLRTDQPSLAEEVLTTIIQSGKFNLIEDRYGIAEAKDGDYFHDMFMYGNQRRSQGNMEAIWTFELEYTKNVSGGFTNAPQQRRVWVPAYHNVPGMAYEVNDPDEGIISPYGGRGNGRMRPSNWVKYELYEEGDMRNSEFNITRTFHYNAADWSATIGIDADGYRVSADSPDAVEVREVKTGDQVVIARADTLEAMFPYTRKWDSFDPDDAWGWTCIKDFPMMRLGETYLLRAEARFKNNNPGGASDDINIIRNRAFKNARIESGNSTLGEVSSSDITMDFILDERARELFAEENRRITLMRTGTLIERAQINTDVSIKGTISGLEPRIMLLPIPLSEIQRNTDIKWDQNPGYN
ncbi:RagB/SusD family nutrient uptake outer membrane protein [Carboxylicivirga linearis]|uniref:RagB/SusD family nutrient uptake outer membrane protein n=1 Tax=Carboxylicivirga linearis TaxID=1628157 RepID=A0ABS5JX28_9BACT|nr:RagB/SusD family nutrient uptake outer membrane protein [Carboxylicivirga linearis]MBS2099379.1 RagB/SusD family nutrient uptake outer membrane protein [Carboxylicivirga linearis]